MHQTATVVLSGNSAVLAIEAAQLGRRHDRSRAQSQRAVFRNHRRIRVQRSRPAVRVRRPGTAVRPGPQFTTLPAVLPW